MRVTNCVKFNTTSKLTIITAQVITSRYNYHKITVKITNYKKYIITINFL